MTQIFGDRFRTFALEAAVALAVALVASLAMRRIGLPATVMLASFGALVLVAVLNRTLLAAGLIMLAPLPSLEQFLGVSLPIGIDPLNVLILLGLAAMTQLPAARERRLWSRPLFVLLLLNVALYGIAWLRTYGQETVGSAEIALLVKPAAILLAGFIAMRITPPARRLEVLAVGMGAMLLIVGVSIALQRAGLYQTTYQAENALRLGIKQFGGLMLDGNLGGTFIATFSVPVYLLLRKAGRPVFGTVVLLAAFPVLLLTLARGAMIAFAVTLLLLAVMDRSLVRGLALSTAVIGSAAIWAFTAGRGQVDILVENYTRAGADTNSQLSGRESIWDGAVSYLSNDSRLLFGGGLDDFKDYMLTSIAHGFATHNATLFNLVTGGVVMLTAYVAFLLVLLVARGMDRDFRSAIRIAVIGYAVGGLTGDLTLYASTAAWLTLLAAGGYLLGPSPQTVAERGRPRLEPRVSPQPI